MEILQTFDGNSTPVKKTTITRSEYYVGEDVEILEETTHVYYLRSSVLGKIIAELDQTGYKRHRVRLCWWNADRNSVRLESRLWL